MLVWSNYQDDMGKLYPMLTSNFRQENDFGADLNLIDLLPGDDLNELVEAKSSCFIPGLTPRQIRIFSSDGGQFLFNYHRPFNQALEDYLLTNLDVAAYEWIGERIKYGRLKFILDNV